MPSCPRRVAELGGGPPRAVAGVVRRAGLATVALLATGFICAGTPDVNRDGKVDILDVSVVSSCLGSDRSDCRCRHADVDLSRLVDPADLDLVRAHYGESGLPRAAPGTPNACAVEDPDLDGDGVVDFQDAVLLASCYGAPVTECRCLAADLDRNGTVENFDGRNVLDAWGSRGHPVAPPDTTPPNLLVDVPADGAEIAADAVDVLGSVDGREALVTIDGARVALLPGTPARFAQRVALAPGDNQITIDAADGTCNGTQRVLHVRRVEGGDAANGVAAGEVFDAASGRPLAGVRAEAIALDGAPPASPAATTSDTRGRYRLALPAGRAQLRLSLGGYTSALRVVAIGSGVRSDPLDAALAPFGTAEPISSLLGGRVESQRGIAVLEVPPGGLAADTSLALAELPPQALAVPPPLGWSVLAAAELAGPAVFAAPLGLRFANPGGRALRAGTTVAWLDIERATWIALGTPTANSVTGSLDVSAEHSGQIAVLAPDPPPWAPPAAVPGAPLTGVAAPADPGPLDASIDPAPRVLFADPAALARVTVTVDGTLLPSGVALVLERAESLAFLDSGALLPEPFAQDAPLGLVADANGARLDATLPVGPTAQFDPLAIAQGAITLRARLAAGEDQPHGRAVGPAGGLVASDDGSLELVIPSGAASELLPVAIAPLAVEVLAPLLQPSDEAPAAFAIDLQGGSLAVPALASVPTPDGVGSGEQLVVARVATLLGRSQLVAVGVASASGERLGVGADAGGVMLPGLREEGRHALLRVPGGRLAFATGRVLGEGGAPRPGALVRADGVSLAAVAGADGRFVLPLAPGSHLLSATDPVTFDAASGSVALAAAGDRAEVELALVETPPRVVGSDPVSGAIGVRLASVLRVDFSEPLAAASIGADALLLTQNGVSVAGVLSPSADRRSLRFVPETALESDRRYQLHVSAAVSDATGNALGSEFVISFSSEDRTRPDAPAPGQVTAGVPGVGPGASTAIAGGPGTLEPGGLAIVVNLTTGVATSFAPSPDGSFGGSVRAARTDRLELRLRDSSKTAELLGDGIGDDDGVCESGEACGNETRVALGPFRDADGRTVVGAEGGRVEGADGVFVEVPAGALPAGTAVRVEPIASSDLALAPPAGFPFVAGLHLDLGGVTPLAALDVGVEAPGDASPDDQVLVVTDVALPSGPAWTVADRAHFADGRYVTASPPFAGVIAEGSYAFLRSEAGCISYVEVRFDLSAQYLVLPFGQPFVAFTSSSGTTVFPAVCDTPLDIRVVDPATGAPLLGTPRRAPAARDSVALAEDVLSDDTVAPIVLGIDTPSGTASRQVEIRFSEPVNADSASNGLRVYDFARARVPGRVELRDGDRVAVFLPDLPFRIGESYGIVLFGVRDRAGNWIEEAEQSFTAFDPGDPLADLASIPELEAALRKCTPDGSCTTSARGVAQLGKVLFVANGLTRSGETYAAPGSPKRLLAIDVSDPSTPRLLGSHATSTNPLALAALPDARVTTPDGVPFAGDLLLVAGGGRVPGGELASKLEVWDVSACTRTPPLADCLADGLHALRGWKLLSTPAGVPPQPGVPPESGVPRQLDVLQQHVPGQDDVLAAYVVVSAIGLEAVHVAEAFNLESSADRAPDGLRRGEFLDVAVSSLRAQLAAIELDAASGQASLGVFSPSLGAPRRLALPVPGSRLAFYENFAADLDGDGNLGAPEDADGDAVAAADEFFDLALVGAGPIDTGCAGPPPCGELLVADLSSWTALAHPGSAAILARVPLPAPAFDVQVDPVGRSALVEMRSAGLAVVDLSFLDALLRPGVQLAEVEAAALSLLDQNQDGRDDRLLGVIAKPDIFAGEVSVDTARGLAFLNGASSGLEVVRVAERCTDLSADFQAPEPLPAAASRGAREDTDARFAEEKRKLQRILVRAITTLTTGEDAIPRGRIAVLEQGSGACFWREPFPQTCSAAFELGSSDHDFEVMVPQASVAAAQRKLDALGEQLEQPGDPDRVKDLSLFAISRDAFEAAEMTVGTPQNGSGDATGDLALGRQTLVLLWILEGEWVPPYQGDPLPDILERMRGKRLFDVETTAIPRLEGYEWSRLQEYNFYKTGARLRIEGACDRPDFGMLPDPGLLDPNDPELQEQDLFGGACDDELRGVGKAAIRTVMARLVSRSETNLRLLPASLDTYRGPTGCSTGVDDVRNPPLTAGGFAKKPCGSFEEFILGKAVDAIADGVAGDLFSDVGVDDLFRFYCAKVGPRCANAAGEPIAGPLFASAAARDAFLAKVQAFIEQSQTRTAPVYDATLASDTTPIGALPFLDSIGAVCREAGLTEALTSVGERRLLRICNFKIVDAKVNGAQPNLPFSPPHVQLVSDEHARKDLLKALGVKNAVSRPLAVRVRNQGPLDVDTTALRLFSGDGVDPDAWNPLPPDHPLADLAAGSARVVDRELQPGEDEPEPVFPLVFDLRGDSPPRARALAFAIDPEQQVVERNRSDDVASFFYHRLGAPPAGPPEPVPPIDVDPDLLCALAPGRLDVEVTIQGVAGDGSYGVTQAAVAPYQEVLLTYRVRNTGDQVLRRVIIERDGQVLATIPELAPGVLELRTEPFVPTQTGRVFLRASARGLLREGESLHSVRSAPGYATLDVLESLETFSVTLFDASPLAVSGHAFTRFNLTHDGPGHEIPVIGTVTDGDGQLGGGRIRIEVADLEPSRPVAVSVLDAEVSGAQDGLGELAVLDEQGNATVRGTELGGLVASSDGRLTLHYSPPPVFVRAGHRAEDFPKPERRVKVLVRQDGVGSTARTIRLRRPPVLLLHGYLGNREVWKDLQPLVPLGASIERWQAFPGFDGRFDLIAVGSLLARDRFDVLLGQLETEVSLALGRWRPGFVLGRFDAIGFSTGAPLWFRLLDRVVTGGRVPSSPMRKILSLSGALDGTDLNNELIRIRDDLPLVKREMPPFDPLRPHFPTPLPGVPTLLQSYKPDYCSIAVKFLGLDETFLLRGAVDDLAIGSPALPDVPFILSSVAAAPSVHFLADANTGNLYGVHDSRNEFGATNLVVGMWGLLGQLCNLSPDENTVETTQLQKDAVEIIGVIAGPLRKALGQQGAKRLDALAKTLQKVSESALENELESTAPKPVFTGASASNDRVLPERSQLDGHAANEPVVTSVSSESVDHLRFRETPRALPDNCLEPGDPPGFRSDVRDDPLGSPIVTCKLMHLLEADPHDPLFVGGGP